MQILDPYTTYGWPLLVALAFALVLAQYAWRRRTMPGALPFIGMMACGSAWLAVSVLQTISTDFLVKVRWHQARDVVALLVASASLYFAVAYARLSKWQSPRTYLLLAAVPVVYALFNLTNEAHHLVWARVWVDTSGIIRDDLGPVKLIAALYGYLLVMLTWAILAWLFIRSPAHRGPVGMLLVAQIATRVAYVMHATSQGLVASLEPVILVSVLGYIIYFLAIFRLGGFDLVPSARGTAFARMSEGVLVLDDHNLIVEMNPMAQTLLGAERANLIDRDAARLRVISSDLFQAVCATAVGHVEVELETCVPRRSLAVTVSPLPYDGGRRNGRLVLLRDITEHKRAERKLEQRNSELEGIFQALPDLYFRLASDGVIVDYRAGQAADLYLPAQEFLGRRMRDILPPETGRLLDEARRETLTTQTVVSLEYSLPMTGGARYFEARLLPLLSDQVIIVVRNVTERKESDEALRRAYEDMERRVAERTVELQQANEALNLENIERQRAEVALRTLNATLEERVIDRTRELGALYEVSAAAARIESLSEFLETALGMTVEALRSESGVILLSQEEDGACETGRLHVAAVHGAAPASLAWRSTAPDVGSLYHDVLSSRQPRLIAHLTADGREPAVRYAGDPITLLLVPLQADGMILGIAGLARDAAFSFRVEEVALLTTIADQIAVSVRGHHLRQTAAQTHLLAERQRVARELHNSVTQSLYGLVAFTEVGQARLDSDDLIGAGHWLARIGETARQALREMRLFIYQSRPEVLQQEGLVSALQSRLAAVEGRADLQVHLCADEMPRFPLPLESALYQVAQEALNNVLRHAHATSVVIVLRCEEDEVILEVSDDGEGFDTTREDRGGMGLSSMREAIREVGGTLEITSAPSKGTTVWVTAPIKE